MKTIKYIFVVGFLASVLAMESQNNTLRGKPTMNSRRITVEPGIGIQPMPIVDVRLSSMIQANPKKHLNFVSYTYFTRHNAFKTKFNFIKSEYSYSIAQLFGIGTSLYSKKTTHSISLIGGVKFESFKEVLDNPRFEKVTASSRATTPEFGLLYDGKVGSGNYFFSYRAYVPLAPYPTYTADLNAVDGNLANVSLEIGVGIRLK